MLYVNNYTRSTNDDDDDGSADDAAERKALTTCNHRRDGRLQPLRVCAESPHVTTLTRAAREKAGFGFHHWFYLTKWAKLQLNGSGARAKSQNEEFYKIGISRISGYSSARHGI